MINLTKTNWAKRVLGKFRIYLGIDLGFVADTIYKGQRDFFYGVTVWNNIAVGFIVRRRIDVEK